MLAVVLMGASCNRSDDDTAETTTTAAPRTTSTTAVDVTTVPATIDMIYVQRVFDVLDQIRGDVVKEFLTKRQLTPDMVARLGAVYNPQELDREIQARNQQLRGDFSVFRQPVGIRRTMVRRLITARADCISVEAFFDNSQVLNNPPAPTPTYVALQPTAPVSDPRGDNPTPFAISSEDKDPADPCAAS